MIHDLDVLKWENEDFLSSWTQTVSLSVSLMSEKQNSLYLKVHFQADFCHKFANFLPFTTTSNHREDFYNSSMPSSAQPCLWYSVTAG